MSFKSPLRAAAFGLAASAIAVAASTSTAAVVNVTGLTLSNGNPATVTTEPTLVQSFTTDGGTVSTLAAPVSATGAGNASLRPVGAAEDTSAGTAADLNVARGLANVNAGSSVFDVQFGQTLTGAAGPGNDIFLLDLGNAEGNVSAGDDALTLFALNSSGAVIGSPVSVVTASFGDTGKLGTYTTNGTNSLTRIIAGLALDVEDFGVTGGISGIRLGAIANSTGNGIDPLAIGFNTAAAVPEPTSAAAALLGCLALAARRRRA